MKEYSSKYNKKGILLVNLGTPETVNVADVKKYLREFLSDKRVIEANPLIWKFILNCIILPFRSKKTAKLYKSIWNNKDNMSPLLYYTMRQSEKLQNLFDDNTIVDFAMRYGKPSIKEKILLLQSKGVTEIKVLPLYPQYSATTTATVYDKLYSILLDMRMQPTIVGIKPYYDHPEYIHIIKNSILRHVKSLNYQPDKLILSFHGLPHDYLKNGDPYYCHCHKTHRLVKASLQEFIDYPIELSFQSRFGPKKWLEPYTTDIIKDSVEKGFKKIVLATPGFSADCLETLEELQVAEKEEFLKHGGEEFSVVPCLNDDDDHILFLKKILS